MTDEVVSRMARSASESPRVTADAEALTTADVRADAACGRALWYRRHSDYPDNADANEFLVQLAGGARQVTAYAVTMLGADVDLSGEGDSAAERITREKLSHPKVAVAGAAIRTADAFARIDLLRKEGETFAVLAASSASWDAARDRLLARDGTVASDWREVTLSLAFQSWVVRQAYPATSVKSTLTLVDKAVTAEFDGLHSAFALIRHEDGRPFVDKAGGPARDALGRSLVTEVDATAAVAYWLEQGVDGRPWATFVSDTLAVLNGHKPLPTPGRHCRDCDFRGGGDEHDSGLGECYTELGVPPADVKGPFVFDLYTPGTAEDVAVGEGRYLLRGHTASGGPAVAPIQARQIGGKAVHDAAYFAKKAVELQYPLHFIDFETCAPALPFSAGRRPYETVAFQFSHHVVEVDGKVDHRTQFLSTDAFPNFEFLRELRKALGDSGGTIFRYSHHENTVLRHLRLQLLDSKEADRDELVAWIENLASPSERAMPRERWTPVRRFVDLSIWVREGFWHPRVGRSFSIKDVLPAVLEWSVVSRRHWSQGAFPSQNSTTPTPWLKIDANGAARDPYAALPPIASGVTSKDIEKAVSRLPEQLADGGAAMMAFADIQGGRLAEDEVAAVKDALYRYCEVDTRAMVMVFEALCSIADWNPTTNPLVAGSVP
jgi:hypothetical protein